MASCRRNNDDDDDDDDDGDDEAYVLLFIKFFIFTRTSLRYVRVLAIANPSVVCNVHVSYSGR